jgi:hypothetical protein
LPNPYALFASDKTAETQGIDLDYGPFRITIARAGGSNRKYSLVFERVVGPHRLAIQNGTFDEDASVRLLAQVYAEAIILGWSGVTDAQGQPLEFNTDNCVKLLTDLPDLFSDIQAQAGKAANFRASAVEDAAKN